MKITDIEIVNFGGIDKLVFTAGRLNCILGSNEAGKTSLIAALRACAADGAQIRLKRGTKEGKVRMVFADGLEAVRTFDDDGKNKIKVTHPQMGPMQAARRALDTYVPPKGFDVVNFVEAKRADRMTMFVEALPLRLTPEQEAELQGLTVLDVAVQVREKEHALLVLDFIQEHADDFIKKTRADITAQTKLSKELGSQVIEVVEVPSAEEMRERMRARISAVDVAVKAADVAKKNVENAAKEEKGRIGAKAVADCIEAKKRTDLAIEKLKRDIDMLEVSCQQEMAAINHDMQIATLAVDKKTSETLDRLRAEDQPRIDNAKVELALVEHEAKTCDQRRSNNEKAKAQGEMIVQVLNKIQAGEKTVAECNTKIAMINRIRSQVVSKLPIPDVSIVDDDVAVRGVPFEEMSGAQQYELAFDVVKQFAGDGGVAILDGGEKLDTKRWALFKEKGLASGLQLFVARVDDGALRVEVTP